MLQRRAQSQTADLLIASYTHHEKFRSFWSHVKIRGRVGEISIPNVEALPTTELPEYIWWPSTARAADSERGWLIKKKRKFTGQTWGLPD